MGPVLVLRRSNGRKVNRVSVHCEDCGVRMYGGFCPNCDEEHFIANQYRELGESVPQCIAESELEQIEKRKARKP
jgi:hypothetical protein